ncbi:MAG: Anaphase-promoting complex, cyclosome, subunit 3 [Acidobacteria bacterium]|nr:Anaphase-promoting complex, cyclosome, subunit 3 [Acidobacteriota bacterium]
MRTLALAAALLLGATDGAVFERYLSPDRPEDRAILNYLALAEQGQATSEDLAELGVLLLDKGFPKDAERYLEAAVEADKENVEAIYRLGLVRQRMGKEGSAIRCYRKVVNQRPGHAYASFMLALAEEKRGRRESEALLLRYERDVAAASIAVPQLDPAAVRAMMAALPETEAAAPAVPPAAQPTPQPASAAQPAPPAHAVPPPPPPPKPSPAAPGAPPPIFGGATPTPTR